MLYDVVMTRSDEVQEEPTLVGLLALEQKCADKQRRSADKAQGWVDLLEALPLEGIGPAKRAAHAHLLAERRRILATVGEHTVAAEARLRAAKVLAHAPDHSATPHPTIPPSHEAF